MNSRESELYVSKWVHFCCVCREFCTKEFFSHISQVEFHKKKVSKNLSDLGNFSKDWTQKKTFWSIRTKSFFEIKKNRYEEVQWTTAEESFNRQWPYVLVTLLARSLLHFPRTFRLLSSGWMKIALNIFTNAYNQLYAHSERCAMCSNTTPENKNIQVEGCDEILDPLKTRTSQHKNIFSSCFTEKIKFLLAIFSCMGVWEWLYVVLFSLLCVFTLQFFAFFSLLHHIYVQEYIEPLNLLLILLCSHSLLLFFFAHSLARCWTTNFLMLSYGVVLLMMILNLPK